MKLLTAILCVLLVDVAVAHFNHFEKVTHETDVHINGSALVVTQSNEDKCIDLNQNRHDLRDCCDYPRIHFFKIYSRHCIDECVGTKDICCGMLCVWRNTKVKFHEGTLNLDGLKRTLIDSVRHKDEWEDLVHQAVDQCDAEVDQEEADKMCKIPKHLGGLVNCATKKLFLMCPRMHKSPKCETTKKYVEECL